MSQIAYDPVKDRFATFIRNNRFFRAVFYQLLDLFFLRSWYVRKFIRKWHNEAKVTSNNAPLQILDAGCGFGQYDYFLLRQFDNVIIDAVDVKQDYLDDCRHFFEKDIRQGRITFKEMDLLDPKLEKKYDLIICVDVLEHIEEDVRVMKHLSNSLKPGGLFIMHSPSHYAEDDADGDESFVGEHARAGYSKEDISSKLNKADLNPVDLVYSYGATGHMAWVFLIKWPMLWLTKFGIVSVLILPFWYLITLLPGLILMQLDLVTTNVKGTGILASARK
jgi:SAM-dependent methyltransferase